MQCMFTSQQDQQPCSFLKKCQLGNSMVVLFDISSATIDTANCHWQQALLTHPNACLFGEEVRSQAIVTQGRCRSSLPFGYIQHKLFRGSWMWQLKMSGSWRKTKLERHHDGTGSCDLGGKIEMCHGQWTGHEIATELPQNKIPHHATCLKYDTLIVICEHVTCLKQFRTVLSQIAFSGHDRSTKQRWQGVGSSAGAHKIQKNELVDSMNFQWTCHHPVILGLWSQLWMDFRHWRTTVWFSFQKVSLSAQLGAALPWMMKHATPCRSLCASHYATTLISCVFFVSHSRERLSVGFF